MLVALSSKLVASVLQIVMQQLASPAMKEVSQIWNVDKELQELLVTYAKIKALIDRWEIDGSNSVETWLHKLEGYCYDTEDLVDHLRLTFAIENERLRPKILSSLKHFKIPHKIANLHKKLERLSSQIEGVLNARRQTNSTQAPSAANYCYRSPLLDKTPLVFSPSRDQIKQSIIMELTGSSDQQSEASGVAIIGMDGLGKTSLARSILEDARIKNHFPIVLTACVSGDFQMERIVKKLVEEYSHQRDVNLEELLDSQRALIVLDDVWSVTDEDWDRFKCNYFSSSPGWKILTTTRNPKVAEVTQSIPSYLDTMTDEECKELIMQRANLCGSNRGIWDDDVEVIAKKCKGMPIVASKLGLILSCKGSVDKLSVTFQQLKNTHLQGSPEVKQVFHSLKLNEPKLPPHLKRCFAYFSLFSPGHKFKRDELIQLWEVEGFVQTQQGGGLQPTGSECFDEMLSRSILKPLKSTSDEQTMYEMHDFNYEFAQRLASEAFQRIDEGTTTKFPAFHRKSLRHLSLICENIDVSLLEEVKNCTRLRTFLLLHQNEPKRRTLSSTFFRKLKSLRLLNLSHTNVSKLLEPVSPLKLLRYLDLSKTDILALPEPIYPLCALQILKLDDCFKLVRLPKDLNRLISLTHLHVNMKRLACLPSKMGMLTNLEILSSYIVASNEGNKVAELKNMENLREICISRLENISDRKDAEESMLSTKTQLKRLVLEWDSPGAEMENVREILEGLKPHNDLKELVLRNYRCQQFPTWLSSSSQKLASVYLQNCQDCEVLPSLGQLPLLKTLVLHSIDNVEKVDGHFCGLGEEGFLHLESLEFREMRGLVRWTGLKKRDMPHLRTLKIIGCQMLICLPSLIHQGCLLYLEINNCPVLESLPEIPSSMNSESGQLIVVDSPLVEERCQVGGDDWPKIKDMAYIRRFQTTTTSTASTIQPSQSNEAHEDEAAPTTAKRMIDGDYILLQGIGVLVKRWMAMLDQGGCFYKPNWVVFLLVVTLIPIIYGVVIRC